MEGIMLELKNVSKFYYNKGIVSSGINKVNLKFDMENLSLLLEKVEVVSLLY